VPEVLTPNQFLETMANQPKWLFGFKPLENCAYLVVRFGGVFLTYHSPNLDHLDSDDRQGFLEWIRMYLHNGSMKTGGEDGGTNSPCGDILRRFQGDDTGRVSAAYYRRAYHLV
jgi:hypothetical protein